MDKLNILNKNIKEEEDSFEAEPKKAPRKRKVNLNKEDQPNKKSDLKITQQMQQRILENPDSSRLLKTFCNNKQEKISIKFFQVLQTDLKSMIKSQVLDL